MFQSARIIIAIILSTLVAAQDDDNSTVTNNNNTPFEVPEVFNISDPVVGATLEHYQVSTDVSAITKFACVDEGSRCTFNRLSYDSVDVGTGQDTENTEGAVWAATTEDAVLTLGFCNGDDNTAISRSINDNDDDNQCIVTCNANCTCAYITDDTANDPQPCTTFMSRAPTPSPKTSVPVAQVCPQQQFVNEFCETLMQQQPSSIPEGTIDNYDCFNFCGGVWIDTCDIATGTCGTTQCDNATATGTLNGIVKGCTKEHYKASSGPSEQNNENGTSGGSSNRGGKFLLHGLVGMIVIGVFHR